MVELHLDSRFADPVLTAVSLENIVSDLDGCVSTLRCRVLGPLGDHRFSAFDLAITPFLMLHLSRDDQGIDFTGL